MNKTIKELADELGLSKQTIQKVIERMPEYEKPVKLGNRYNLSLVDQKKIKIILGFETDKLDNSNRKIDNSDIYSDNSDKETDKLDINGYIGFLSEQLISKDTQIENLQKLLDQQQVLTLQANKKIEQLEMQNEESEKDEMNLKSKSFWQRLFNK